ncbi:hypothetical protein L9F63_027725, partial [Diploptera punctata]
MAEGGGQELVCSLYISPISNSEFNTQEKSFTKTILQEVIESLNPSGRWVITKTECGLIVAFSSESECREIDK